MNAVLSFLPFFDHTMSHFSVLGHFALGGGTQTPIFNPKDGKTMNFTQYDFSLECPDGTSTSVQIRHYSPSGSIAPPNTVAFLFAKSHIPSKTSDPIHLHTLFFYPILGNPSGPDIGYSSQTLALDSSLSEFYNQTRRSLTVFLWVKTSSFLGLRSHPIFATYFGQTTFHSLLRTRALPMGAKV